MIVCGFEGQASISLPVASCLPNLKTGPAQHFFSASKFVVMFWTEFTISMRWISMCVIWLCSWWKKLTEQLTGVNRTNLVVFNFALGIVRFCSKPYLKKLHLCKLCSNHLSMVLHLGAFSDGFFHSYAWIHIANDPFPICMVTISTALMREMRIPSARASRCEEKSLRRDALVWPLLLSRKSRPKVRITRLLMIGKTRALGSTESTLTKN